MIYEGVKLVPLRDTYRPGLPRSVSETVLAGGPARITRNEVRPQITVDVQYVLRDKAMIEWFRLWYRRDTKEGGSQFTARLAFNNALNDYICQWSSPPSITSVGYRAIVAGRLDVLRIDTSALMIAEDSDFIITDTPTAPPDIIQAITVEGPSAAAYTLIDELSYSFSDPLPPPVVYDPYSDLPRLSVLPERGQVVELLPWGAVRAGGLNRPDTLNNPSYFTAVYRLTGDMMNEFEIWYKYTIAEGSKPFVADFGYGEMGCQIIEAPVFSRYTGFIAELQMRVEAENPLIPYESPDEVLIVVE